MGAHVFAPAYLRDVLLPSGRILGWSQSWFAGFPVFYFYFPLPSLVIVFLDLFLPYGAAFKIVTVLGLVATPPATYYLARSLNLGKLISLVAAASGVVFVFMENFTIYGGNVASTLAGEFSFSWSFALCLVYLGLVIRGVREDRRLLVWAAVVLGLAALCHIITTFMVVLASIPILFWKGGARTLLVWLGGFAVAAFWAIPLLVSAPYSSDMGWTPLSSIDELLPAETWLLLPFAVVGAVLMARRTSRVIPVIVFTLVPLIYYPIPDLVTEAFPQFFTDARWKLWNGRLLPYWYFGVAFLGAIAIGFATRWIIRQLPDTVSMWWSRGLLAVAGGVGVFLAVRNPDAPGWMPWAIASLTLVLLGVSLIYAGRVRGRTLVVTATAAVLGLGALAGVSFVDGWAKWNYEGYEAKESWGEYQDFMATMATLEPARVQWEYHKDFNDYGTTMSLMLIPYWTGYERPSMEGLFFESSLTVPFHFLNQAEMSSAPSAPVGGLDYHTFDFERGIRHLGLYGVEYYVAYTAEAKEKAEADPRLERVTASAPFVVYRLPATSLVQPLSFQPGVYQGESFHDFALEWYEDVDNLDRLVLNGGPDELPTVTTVEDLDRLRPLDAPGGVSDIEVEPHRISFRTDAVGVPHLVKVSYFPNWTATGAEGPFHATPSLMVVVPTDDQVVLEFGRRWSDYLGLALTGAALVLLTGYVVNRVVSRRREPAA